MRIGWFSTGRDEEARRLLEVVLFERMKGLKVDIAFVFCNREYGESPVTDQFLDFVKNNGLKLLTLCITKFYARLKDKG
jgi:phosphoribosylglycinamide formyltransferase-1